MSQKRHPSLHHPALFFLLSKRFSLYLGAFLTLIYFVLCVHRRGSLLTTYTLFPVFAAALTFAGIRVLQTTFLRTFLIRKYGTVGLGFVLRARTEWDSNGVPSRVVLIEYGSHQRWFHHNAPERSYVTVRYNPFAHDQVMVEKDFSSLDMVVLLLGPLVFLLVCFGSATWFLWLLFTSP